MKEREMHYVKNKKRVFMQNLITLRVYIRKKTKEIINFFQVFC